MIGSALAMRHYLLKQGKEGFAYSIVSYAAGFCLGLALPEAVEKVLEVARKQTKTNPH